MFSPLTLLTGRIYQSLMDIHVYILTPSGQEPYVPHLGNYLDLRGDQYHKKLEVSNIVYNPYQKLFANVIK